MIQTGVTSRGEKLTYVLPGARFIFPTTKRRRATALNREKLTQWFDVESLEDRSYCSYTQLHGLKESHREILEIINPEAEKVPSRKNNVLGDISRGCAMGLISLLSLELPIGSFIG